jgi:predicted Zn-dependent protease
MRSMVAKNPDNALARFGLANELMKVQQHADAAAEYEVYLARYDDEGNGWGRLAEAYEQLGRPEDARAALAKGIAASRRFGHAGMANELEARLEELNDA